MPEFTEMTSDLFRCLSFFISNLTLKWLNLWIVGAEYFSENWVFLKDLRLGTQNCVYLRILGQMSPNKGTFPGLKT